MQYDEPTFVPLIPHQFRQVKTICGQQNSAELGGAKKFKSSAQVAPSVGPVSVAPPKSCGLKPRRKRASPVKVRLSGSEKAIVQRKAVQAELSVNAFIKAVILKDDYKPPLSREKYRELFRLGRELTGMATNINQMAHKLNGGASDAVETRMLLKQLLEPVLATLGSVRQVLGHGTSGPMR